VRAGEVVETAPESPLIVRVAGVHGGEPVIRGTRVPVRSIVIAYERTRDVARVARSFTLDSDEVAAALAYYDVHRREIDEFISQRERDAMA
jgi:uncharacterized protein (DUF433 family)